MSSKVYVLDTNIILHNTNFIKELCDGGNNIIVIPETVLIELEDFKKNFTELGYQARSFARMLASCTVLEVDIREIVRVVKMQFEEGVIKDGIVQCNDGHSNAKRSKPSPSFFVCIAHQNIPKIAEG